MSVPGPRVCNDDRMLAGGWIASSARRRRRTAAASGVALALALASCGGDGSADEDAAPLETAGATTSDTDLPTCRDVDRAVAVAVFGAATTGAEGEAAAWMDDPDAEPEARPGAAELADAYRAMGYDILYVTLLPSEARVGDQPVVDATMVWLGLNDFPVGQDVRVWAPQGAGAADPSVALIEELARLGAGGTELDAGYAGDPETVFPLAAGGIPSDRVFLLGDGDGGASSGGASAPAEVPATVLREEDLPAHAAEVQALPPICR